MPHFRIRWKDVTYLGDFWCEPEEWYVDRRDAEFRAACLVATFPGIIVEIIEERI